MESTLEKPFDKEQELKEARGKVSTLKRELEEKARKNAEKVPTSQNTDENLKLSLLKKNNPNPLQEEMAGDSYENLDRLETATDAMHKIAVNAPHPAIAMNGQDILNAMPQLDNLQMAKVINTSRKRMCWPCTFHGVNRLCCYPITVQKKKYVTRTGMNRSTMP